LRARLDGHVIAPDDACYDEARSVFVPQVDRRPAAIVRPGDAREVAEVVALARDEGLELAVRSGGHSLAGHGVSEGGIVLDLVRLKGLELDPGRRVAWAETGLTAGELTAAAAAHGLAVPLGDSAGVGIGGLTLGGGVGCTPSARSSAGCSCCRRRRRRSPASSPPPRRRPTSSRRSRP
jgi:FAD/FMN-containing dehydrogenase